MEGIEQNPIVYDLMSEMAFRWDRVDVKVIILLKIRQLMLQLLFTQSFKPQIVTFKHHWFVIATSFFSPPDMD